MKLITGRPHRLLKDVIQRMGRLIEEEKACMLIVPSQYTLQAEIEVMTQLNLNGSFLIDVLSPSRLRSRIFERAGEPTRIIIDGRGKSMVLTEIIDAHKEEFIFYKNLSGKTTEGFVQKMAELIASFKRSGTTVEALARSLSTLSENDPIKRKLTDAALIYAHYEARMAGQLADDEDISQEMRIKMASSGVMTGKHVFVYGFDMITETFARDLLQIDHVASSVNVAVETDANSAPDGRLFAPVNFSLNRLRTMADETSVLIEQERITTALETPDDLRHIEAHLFALNSPSYAQEPRHIEVHAASTQRAEVHKAAGQVRRLMQSGVSTSQMAIVYPKESGYAPLLAGILPMYGIEAYIAERRAAEGHPICRFVLSALSVISNGFRTSDVVECIRSGFLALTAEESDALISYAEGNGVRADGWTRPFTYANDLEETAFAAINAARERVVAPLKSFSEAMKRTRTADETVQAILDLLESTSAFDRLGDIRQELIEAGLHREAQDCAQVWNALMETLDQLHTLIGGRAISSKTVLGLLESGLSALELAALPPADGAVICGEIGNVRTAQVDTLIVLGMNDSPAAKANGLFGAEEKEAAERATGVYLGMSASEHSAMAQLDLLKMLSGAQKKLILSYALADETGRALREGAAIQAIRRVFPKLTVRGGLSQEEWKERLVAPEAAREALALHLSRVADGKESLDTRYASAYEALNASNRVQLMLTTRNLGPAVARTLNGVQARSLYGRPTMSVSRLELFAQCPYRHFVRYGLSPQQETEPGVNPAELGTLYHEAAEQFTRAVTALPEFPHVDEATCSALMEQAVAPLIDGWQKSPLGESARGQAIARRIRKTAKRAGRSIVSQFAEGSFKPFSFEMVFGQGGVAPIRLELADGSCAYLQGRIDRIDVLEGDPQHIRVIDYKSGSKRFDPTMAYWGIQLQLLIYLSAALQQIPGAAPGGFFYCRIADPTIKSESRIQEEVEKQIAKKLALAGISLADVRVLRAQDSRHAGMIKKDGTISGTYRASMVDEQSMLGLASFGQGKAKQLAMHAFYGEIDDAPATTGSYNACTTCDYAAICGFDPARKPRRRLAKKSIEDLIAQRD